MSEIPAEHTMSRKDIQVLLSFLDKYQNDSRLASLIVELKNINLNKAGLDQLLQCYNRAIPIIESKLWSEDYDEGLILQYQSMFHEMEHHIAQLGTDPRHHFILVIPVADRPQHLRTCLDSIYQLCECFLYGGRWEKYFQKVSVIIADDSQYEHNICQHRELAEIYTNKGLATEYFGLEEQIRCVESLPPQMQRQLTSIIGGFDRQAFYHKGASITRNLAYLRLSELRKQQDKLLFYFIDSDQEFKQNIPSLNNKEILGLNYFYHLNRLFTEKNIKILTGKVVGDPPVSPAVMAGNFLQDITLFFETLISCQPEEPCTFHYGNCTKVDAAAYHDMAELFGYKKDKTSFHYACLLAGKHNHQDSFIHFANQVSHFFDGEHPTRRMYFQYDNISDSVTPARTVYTGNYIFIPEMLKLFIPFAPLKLRMAGPVLGRLIRTEVGKQFVSANLPMLHKRTVEDLGQSEFRPGIERQDNAVDLSGEFKRQFFGDVMLFSIDSLTEQGYPVKLCNPENIINTIKNTEERLLKQYREQQAQIKTQLATLKSLVNNKTYWWNNRSELNSPLFAIRDFIDNMTLNFGDEAKAYQYIQDDRVREQYRQRILEAILNYPRSKQCWQQCINSKAGKNS